jgi:hypothetical protein
MTNHPDSFNNNPDDLDPFALLLKMFSFTRRYGRMIALTSIVGIFCGIMIYIALPKSYSSKMVIETTVLTNTEEIQLINDWDDLLNGDGYLILARNFNCDPVILRKLRSINAEPILKTGPADGPSGFYIDIVIQDTSLLKELQNAIIYGLENSSYVKERIAVRKANLADLIENVKKEMFRLDSVKSNVELIIDNRKKYSSSLMVDISGISSQMVSLREKLLNYQEQLRFVDAIRVLQDFVKSGRPKQPRLSVLLAVGLAFGFFCGFCFALYRIIRAKYRIALKNSGQAG